MSQGFQFKQFYVAHDQCAMKVSTDSVLLGAWARAATDVESIIDVGCGSGVLSMMMAQRNPLASIYAIELVDEAAQQAKNNILDADLSADIFIHTGDVFIWAEQQTPSSFQHIISNPPYFKNSLKNKDKTKSYARHDTSFSINKLFEIAEHLLTRRGVISLVIPMQILAEYIAVGAQHLWYLSRQCNVVTLEGKAPKLVLVEFNRARQSQTFDADLLVIQEASGQYTQAFLTLTKDFYLRGDKPR